MTQCRRASRQLRLSQIRVVSEQAQQEEKGRRPRVVGVFADEGTATRCVEHLVDEDFPMDQMSLLHRGGGMGDSPLGIVYGGPGERVKVWGEQGVLWGALGGLLAGLSGLFLVPGIGAVFAAGPIVEALVGAIVGGTTLAGAAALTSITIALRRMGVPAEKLTLLHNAIDEGRYVVMLHTDAAQSATLAERLGSAGAENVFEI